jgi:hypothetical protein
MKGPIKRLKEKYQSDWIDNPKFWDRVGLTIYLVAPFYWYLVFYLYAHLMK